MSRMLTMASRMMTGTTCLLLLAAVVLGTLSKSARADDVLPVIPIRQKCVPETGACAICAVGANGDCNDATGNKNGSCAGANICPDCTCDYVSTLAPCVCSK